GDPATDALARRSKQLLGQGVAVPRGVGDLYCRGAFRQARLCPVGLRLREAARQASSGSDALDAPMGAAATQWTVGPDDDVADVAGVASKSVQQVAIKDDAAPNSSRDNHPEHVVRALARA